jgi:hypothetical protein
MTRFVLLAAILAAGLVWAASGLARSPRGVPEARTASGAPDQVIQWNQELLTLLQAPGAQPASVHPTRTMAIVQLAVSDAVDSIQGGHHPYLPGPPAPAHASAPAAVASAARTSLLALLPSERPAIDAMYRNSLAQLGASASVRRGIRVGDRAAAAILAARANDGSALSAPPFVPGSVPGAYRATPPAFSPPVFGQWPNVRPFVLRRGDQFRSPPPPSLSSARYVDEFNEVKSLGRNGSTTRSADQTAIGKFWGAAPIWIVWNQVAEMAASGFHYTLAQNARLFARLDAGLADSVIALYEGKYTYNRWRPVTAITAIDTGNPAAVSDPTWTPLAVTAPDPSYPGAHAAASETAAVVLADSLGSDSFPFSLTNPTLPGLVRSFGSFSQAADEAAASRIFAGQHFRSDEDAGLALGRQVGDFVSDHLLVQPARIHHHHGGRH